MERKLLLLHAWYHWEKVDWLSEIPTVKLSDKPIIHKELPIRILVCLIKYECAVTLEESIQDFPGSTMDKNLPANAGDTSSVPGQGRFHMQNLSRLATTMKAHTQQRPSTAKSK